MNQNTQYEMGATDFLEDTEDNNLWTLTQKEKRLKEALSEIQANTLIGISIRKRLAGGSVRGFRQMINELKNQYRDCGRERMIEVLGINAVKLIEAL